MKDSCQPRARTFRDFPSRAHAVQHIALKKPSKSRSPKCRLLTASGSQAFAGMTKYKKHRHSSQAQRDQESVPWHETYHTANFLSPTKKTDSLFRGNRGKMDRTPSNWFLRLAKASTLVLVPSPFSD